VFPETSWTTIRQAGSADERALERFASLYREPVLAFMRCRRIPEADAEDLCQEVFLRIIKSSTLAKVDPDRGKFRSLLLAIATHVIQDRGRKASREPKGAPVEPVVWPDRDEEFDREWVMHLSGRALARLKVESPHYHAALEAHLEGRERDRQKVWIARKKLLALIRDEVARTCSSQAEFEQEVAYLSAFLSRKV